MKDYTAQDCSLRLRSGSPSAALREHFGCAQGAISSWLSGAEASGYDHCWKSPKLDEAYRLLQLKHLTPWPIEFVAIAASDAFRLHQERMQVFDLQRSEEGKKILIDAILIEAIQSFKRLKIWKGMNLESEVAHGAADYLVTENLGYFEAPLLCVIEAKKDDFEQGLAPCLVELQACQQINQAIDRTIAVFGIVTNGSTWQFYQSTPSREVYETLPYAVSEISAILGILHILFQQCEQNLA